MRKHKIITTIASVLLTFAMVCNTVCADGDKIVAEINEVTFPDAEFRNHILTGSHYVWDENNNQIEIVYDANKDGKLSESEVANVKQHLVAEMPIYDLTGIEYFTSIIELACQWTQISELDLSKNTELQILNCYRTNLQGTLDLSNNTKLEGVSCGRNNELTGIDVSGCKELNSIDFVNSGVEYIDLSDNTKLESLSCADTPIKELDLRNNTELIILTCYNTDLTGIDLSKNSKLESLDCSVNDIEEIDLSNNLELVSVNLGETLVKGIDLSKHDKLTDLTIAESFVWLNIGNNGNLSVNMRDGHADITVKADGFDITEMFPGIDSDKITIVSGASKDDNMVSGYEEGTPILYTYDCGTAQNGDIVLNVTLNVDVVGGETPDVTPDDDAKPNVPSQDVLDVYKAYEKVQDALSFGYDEDFVIACEEFEAVLDIYNDLSEDDMNALAALLSLENGEEAYNQILCDWINANIILELGEVYDAYVSEPNIDTAKALVEKYDEVFSATEMFLPEDFALFRNAVFCIDDYYEEAKMLLADASDEGEADEEEADKDATPKTGDSSDMMMPLVVMVAAACVVVIVKKKQQS